MLEIPAISKLVSAGQLSRWRLWVPKVNRESERFQGWSNDDLLKHSLSLRYRASSGQSSESLLIEAYALVREATGRTLGMRHYPVQILGGIALHYGAVAVMQTGEGKTLTATLPMYLASLKGDGAHLATANDYLAQRDAELMRPAYELLGLKVGVVTADSEPAERRSAYAADVTYSTAKEIGFDFLRDRLQKRQSDGVLGLPIYDNTDGKSKETVQREFYFALVDEADSILIDEARTPLIVSSAVDGSESPLASLYRWAYDQTGEFAVEEDYEEEAGQRRVTLTAAGRRKIRSLPMPRSLAAVPMLDIYEFVERAIAVELNYQRERHYVVDDDEVKIVDEFTGRIAEGRKWRSGLHQAIEAREGLKISQETGEAARITIQDLFLRYERIAGMTGTVANSGPELKKIYGLQPLEVPTNRPPQRKQLPSKLFSTAEQKWQAIAADVAEVNKTGRPILIGTRSIDLSQRLSDLLDGMGVQHNVLNASMVADEADIVAAAGQFGKVTVATNMAGRGTDIQLSKKAFEAGGLHVICSELHESARIDRQLIGRCGRQGDPGTFRHYYSLEDDIVATGFDSEYQDRLLKNSGSTSQSGSTRLFHDAQRRVERKHFKLRKQLLFHENQRQQLQREMGQDPYLDTIE